ncbi:hypothetical protein HOL52_04530 [bacterium]|jgi:hypothetical protein|nr:hypothetical protein [bacterium]
MKALILIVLIFTTGTTYADNQTINKSDLNITNQEEITDQSIEKPNINAAINQNPEIKIKKFSFNSDRDYLNLEIKTKNFGFIDISKLKIIYNETKLDQDYIYEGEYIKDENNILYKKNITIKIHKNFKQESNIQIYYSDILMDQVCNQKVRVCKFNQLPKNIFLEREKDLWFLLKANKKVTTIKPKLEIILNQSAIEIKIIQKDPYLKFEIDKIFINNIIKEGKININDEINSLEIQYKDNLSNLYRENITELINKEKIKYTELENLKKEIKNLNEKIKNDLEAKEIQKELNNNQLKTEKKNLNELKNNQLITGKKTLDALVSNELKTEKETQEENTKKNKTNPSCSSKLNLEKINPNNKNKTEYVIIYNSSTENINLEGCILIDNKNNQIKLPEKINNLQRIKVYSKNILNNDYDKIKLIEKNSNKNISECEYKINSTNRYQEISCDTLEIENNKNLNLVNQETLKKEKSKINFLNTENTEETIQEISNDGTSNQNKNEYEKPNLNHNIIITEINANPEGKDKNKEWIELLNKGENFKGVIEIQINGKKELHKIEIERNQYLTLEPKNILTNSKMEINIIGSEQNLIITNNALEKHSYALINNQFQQTELISKTKKNPIKENLECTITNINLNTNRLECKDITFFIESNMNIKENDKVKINYIKLDNHYYAEEIIKINEKKLNLKNTGFTILSISSLIFMHKISL